MKIRWILACAAALVFSAIWTPHAFAADPILFEEAASGILELDGHSRLEIRGFAGTVFVRAGKKGELRYSAATRTARREPQPVGLWLRGGTILFLPVAGHETEELILEIALSEGVRLVIDKQGGKVQVASVLADVTVRASESAVDIRGVGGAVSLDLEGGSLNLANLSGAASVSGSDVGIVTLDRIQSQIELTLSGSAITAKLLQSVVLDLSESTLDIDGAGGSVSGNAMDSRIGLASGRAGGTLELENTPLALDRSRGRFEIETDAEVTFRSLEGSLALTGFGGSVTGDGHSGEVKVANRNALVSLSNIAGPLHLSGDGLTVELAEISNTVTMELVSSEVSAQGLKGGLEIKNEYGDISVKGVEGHTKIENANGNVQALELVGSAEIRAAGPEVRVVWTTLGRDQDSHIENTEGDLFVVFPVNATASIEAEADSIETNLEELDVDGSGRQARGQIGRTKTPAVSLYASGRLFVGHAP
jgi:hypothetical protein